MNLDYDENVGFFNHNSRINPTMTCYAKYLYDKLSQYPEVLYPNEVVQNRDYMVWDKWEEYVDNNGGNPDGEHHALLHNFVREGVLFYMAYIENNPPNLSYEDISLYFMCSYWEDHPPFCFNSFHTNADYKWPDNLSWHNGLPLSYQFNRKASEHIMIAIYEFIYFYCDHILEIDSDKDMNEAKRQRLYYHITNDLMELFDKIQDDCDCMPQLSIGKILPLGCLTPHPDCDKYSHFFSPGIPMEYIRYLMTKTLPQGDSNGLAWLTLQYDNGGPLDPNIFDTDYTMLLSKYTGNTNDLSLIHI